jgi:DNA-binding HxlR family transcriptional regulator
MQNSTPCNNKARRLRNESNRAWETTSKLLQRGTFSREPMHEECVEYIRKVSQVTELLQGKWRLQILCAMRTGPVRLGQLTRLIPSASKKTLRASLKSLELAGIVVRHDMSDTVLHVEYDFEDDLRAVVCSLLDHLADWGGVLEAKGKSSFNETSEL